MVNDIKQNILRNENVIKNLKQKNKKLEQKYDELRETKRVLNKMLENHNVVADAKMKILKDDNFGTCRCTQMFRDGMENMLNKSTVLKHSSNISESINVVDDKMKKTWDEITWNERKIERLRKENNNYRIQLLDL